MALAELIGLPRAAQRATTVQQMPAGSGVPGVNVPKLSSAAMLWKSICSIDRLVGTYSEK
jgi:hypothetical protein